MWKQLSETLMLLETQSSQASPKVGHETAELDMSSRDLTPQIPVLLYLVTILHMKHPSNHAYLKNAKGN